VGGSTTSWRRCPRLPQQSRAENTVFPEDSYSWLYSAPSGLMGLGSRLIGASPQSVICDPVGVRKQPGGLRPRRGEVPGCPNRASGELCLSRELLSAYIRFIRTICIPFSRSLRLSFLFPGFRYENLRFGQMGDSVLPGNSYPCISASSAQSAYHLPGLCGHLFYVGERRSQNLLFSLRSLRLCFFLVIIQPVVQRPASQVCRDH
jgi:hypothetical protein